jgi:hypothetical protein
MKYLFLFLALIIFYLGVRVITSVLYILWHFKLPNLKVYFLYTEKVQHEKHDVYHVYRNIGDYFNDAPPLFILQPEFSRGFRYFPHIDVD